MKPDAAFEMHTPKPSILDNLPTNILSADNSTEATVIRPGKPNVAAVNQPISSIKQETLDKLLSKIVAVNYFSVCKSLGWVPAAYSAEDDRSFR